MALPKTIIYGTEFDCVNEEISYSEINRYIRVSCIAWPAEVMCNWNRSSEVGFVYLPRLPANLQEFRHLITAVVVLVNRNMLERVWGEIDYRMDVCLISKGGHIEHLFTIDISLRFHFCESEFDLTILRIRVSLLSVSEIILVNKVEENPGKNLNQVTCPDRDSNPGHLVSRPDALTVTPQQEDRDITYALFCSVLCIMEQVLFDEILILIVEENPDVYDKRRASYKDEKMKENTWLSIAASLNTDRK
ncbi:hypothetical protein ANN_09383 [Periplaneta americana]|uniref:MADF domain-containing protein n=1 Tax=Periplaneta americana TaxID=6978 RepID=A0ABQ8TNQ0_PERAM|nr:hypothetical protein ANN_09383 [Periplaneta americana]